MLFPYYTLRKTLYKYDIEQISGLQSRYAIRLYELLSQWRSVGKTPLLSTAELRNKMGLADAEYTRIEAFKRRVLGLAIKQINDLTDITADYEQHKQGRLVTGFTFRFKYKTNEKKITANERDPHHRRVYRANRHRKQKYTVLAVKRAVRRSN